MKTLSPGESNASSPIQLIITPVELAKPVTGKYGSRTKTLAEIAALFFKLGLMGFGGPIAHIALMEDEVVRRRRWVTRQHLLDAIAVTNLIPGPNSTEVAIHLGFLRAGRLGGLIAGLSFILPAFLILLGLSWTYQTYGTVPQVEEIFASLKPVVVAILIVTASRLARTGITDWRLRVIGLASMFLTLAFPGGELAALPVAGLLGVWLYGRPTVRFPRAPLASGVLLLKFPLTWSISNTSTLPALAWVFLKAGALLFGGGYVLIPLMESDAVDQFGWLTHHQFLDGVALGQLTPGPIVTTATFVGFMAASWIGASIATVAVFLPSFIYVLFGTGPFLDRIKGNNSTAAFLKGVTAAVVGAIAGVTASLASVALTTFWALAICVVAGVALARYRTDVLWLIAAGAIVGLLMGS